MSYRTIRGPGAIVVDGVSEVKADQPIVQICGAAYLEIYAERADQDLIVEWWYENQGTSFYERIAPQSATAGAVYFREFRSPNPPPIFLQTYYAAAPAAGAGKVWISNG